MSKNIKELRLSTGLTQKAFAEKYEIPLSTLCKWEQGETTPAPYVISLLARTLPYANSSMKKIEGKQGTYYYDENQKIFSDELGNKIFIQEDLEGVKEQNLAIYLDEMYEDFHMIQEKFNEDCKYDKKEDILWTQL